MQIKRGEIYYISKANDTTGSEQNAGRPGIIVSNNDGNASSSVVMVVYTTTQTKAKLPTHVPINTTKAPSIALCEQVVSISKERVDSFIGEVTVAEQNAINRALLVGLGIDYECKVDKMQLDSELMQLAEQKKAEITAIQHKLCDFDKVANENLINPDLEKYLYVGTVNKIRELAGQVFNADREKIENELRRAIGIETKIEVTVDTEAVKKVVDKATEPEKKKKPIDIGKIMALKDAGWKPKDIADEVGLTPNQVSQAIYQYKNRKGDVVA